MPNRLTPRVDLPEPTEGDDYSYAVTFTDGTGSPIDISNWTVSMTIADQGATNAPLVERDITNHDNPTAGKTSWGVPHADTKGIVGTKDYDIQVRKADGTIRTIAIGTITFTDGVTDRDVPGTGGGTGANASAGASIDVTLGDDDTVSINVRGLTNYTDSDVLDAINGASISPGELSVDDSDAVTGGPVGDEGEFIPIWSGGFNTRTLTTTAQTYTRATRPESEQIVPYSHFSLTNISGYYISFSGIVQNETDGESVSVKLGRTTEEYAGTELQVADGSYTRAKGPLAPFDGSLNGNISVLMKCSGGTGKVVAPSATIWGEIA